MNPIPLTTPDGAVLAYACGRCLIVQGVESFGQSTEIEFVERRTTESLFRAEHCGSCLTCRKSRTPSCDVIMCGPCDERHERLRWWRRFGQLWRDTAEAFGARITTESEWLARLEEPDDDE